MSAMLIAYITEHTESTRVWRMFPPAYFVSNGSIRIVNFELREEATVYRPEQPDVRYLIYMHSEAFQTKTKCPADPIWSTR